jgi:transposase
MTPGCAGRRPVQGSASAPRSSCCEPCLGPSPSSTRRSPPASSSIQRKLLASLPGVGTINLAQLLAEVGPVLDRVANAEQAAAECGAAPVTRASGKTSGVYFRWAANRRARKALTAFAHNARMQSPWAGRL